MNEKDTYGIELELLTNKLKKQLNDTENKISIFSRKAKEKTHLQMDANTYLLTQKINDMKSDLATIDTSTTVGKGDFIRLSADIEKADKQLKRFANTEQTVENKSNNLGLNLDKNFKKSTGSIKRFLFSLFSVESVFALVSRASNMYMSTDKKLSDQMNATWNSVGAMLAPIILKIAQAFRVVIAYTNYFIKALTGKDLIGNAIKKINKYNKSLNGTAKASKNASKELSSLDEITNLSIDENNNGALDDIASSFDTFKDIKMDNNVTKVIDKIVEGLKKMGQFIKPFIDWAKDNPMTIIKILGGLGALKLISNFVKGIKEIGTVSPILKTLGTIGVVAVGVDLLYNAISGRNLVKDIGTILKGLQEINKQTSKNYDGAKENTKQNKELNEVYKQQIEIGKKTTTEYFNMGESIFHNINLNKQQIQANKEILGNLFAGSTARKNAAKSINEENAQNQQNLETLKKMASQGLLTIQQKQQYAKLINDEITRNMLLSNSQAQQGKDTSVYKERIKELKDELVKVSSKNWKSKLSLDVSTKDAKLKLTEFIKRVATANKIAGLISGTSNAIMSAALSAIPSYDVGTNYVQKDQTANIHKGEAIIPKKFNNETFLNSGNEETNDLLYELNRNILELSKKPTILNVNGKELAQATYKDYKNEGNRLNGNNTITIK